MEKHNAMVASALVAALALAPVALAQGGPAPKPKPPADHQVLVLYAIGPGYLAESAGTP